MWITEICGYGCLQSLYSVICCTFVIQWSFTLHKSFFPLSCHFFLFLEHKKRYIAECPAFWPYSKSASLLLDIKHSIAILLAINEKEN